MLAELAGLIAGGHLEVPIANVYPLAQVREAYTGNRGRDIPACAGEGGVSGFA